MPYEYLIAIYLLLILLPYLLILRPMIFDYHNAKFSLSYEQRLALYKRQDFLFRGGYDNEPQQLAKNPDYLKERLMQAQQPSYGVIVPYLVMTIGNIALLYNFALIDTTRAALITLLILFMGIFTAVGQVYFYWKWLRKYATVN